MESVALEEPLFRYV